MNKPESRHLKIVVLVKYVPNSDSQREFDHNGVLHRHEGIMSELDEYAMETALQLAEENPSPEAAGQVIALTMGPSEASGVIKHCLQMGAHEGVHIMDDSLAASDVYATSQVLAAAVEYIGEVDLVITGMSSTDGGTSAVPAQIAERLQLPQVTFATSLTIDKEGTLRATRETDASLETLESSLPALVSVTDQINKPRYPNFRGIMAAKNKTVRTLGVSDLSMNTGDGIPRNRIVVEQITSRPRRQQGTIIVDEGDASVQLLNFLMNQKLL